MNTQSISALLMVFAIAAPASGPLDRLFNRRQPARCCPPAIVDQPNPAAVQVTTSSGRGSGTLIRPDTILTAAHVVSAASRSITVIFPDGSKVAATLGERDATLDLATLIIPVSAVTPCPIADAAPAIGEPVTAAGFGNSAEPFRCILGKLKSNDGRTLTLPGLARGGDSGGPILDAAGRLIGVVTNTSDPRRTACQNRIILGTCCRRIRDFLGPGDTPDPDPDPDPVPDTPDPDPIDPDPIDPSPIADTPRLDALEARLAALALVVAAIPDCPPCEPGEIDLDALADAVLDRLPGITFQPIDSEGNPSGDPATRRLGETLRLRSYLVEMP